VIASVGDRPTLSVGTDEVKQLTSFPYRFELGW
jgi:hypothetical protein